MDEVSVLILAGGDPSKESGMATPEDALKMMREICLALPKSREGEHFGQAAFYIDRKLFATCGAKRGPCEISFGLEEEHAAALAERDSKFMLHPRDKRGVVIDVSRISDWSEIEELISRSFDFLMSSKTAKRRPTKSKAR